MACDVCGGGDNNLHRTNPDPLVTDIVTNGNIVDHPQRARPWEWCVQQLRNVVTVGPLSGVPMVWTGDCEMGPGAWPCPNITDWDSAVLTDPPVCADCTDGVWTFYRDTVSGAVSHVCVDGVVAPFDSAAEPGPEPCCKQAVDNNGDTILITIFAGGTTEYLNLATGDDSFVPPLTLTDE